MKKFWTPSLVIFLATLFIKTQAQEHRNCATMEVLEQQLQADPSMLQRMEAIERHTENFTSKPQLHTRAVVTIPVVVHIVYRSAVENISDALVQNQIAVLNADFRRLNADATKTPSVFAALAADVEVNFCLAKRNVEGIATTGIMRYSSNRTTDWAMSDDIKKTSSGGVAPWDASRYLNIWVCAIGGGVLGYAQFPGGIAATDGVVIDYRFFGTNTSSTSPYNLGRTATHEVGHWLNLRHIWGDANCGNDLVGDTPTQATSNFGCPTFPHTTCSNGANGDMFMNYMDYTNDACMNMFSAGQKTRMQAVLSAGGQRASLTTSNGCTPGIVAVCAAPTNLNINNITQTGAIINWSAVGGASNYTLDYRVSGATNWTTLTVTGISQTLTGLTTNTTYEYRLKTNCASSSSVYIATATFATTATICIDPYDLTNSNNNTLATATPATVNTTIQALISSSTDNDYFSFSNSTTQPNIKVSLTNIPLGKDYDLRFYNSAGTNIKSSLNSGVTAEKILYNAAPVGTYKVRIYPYSGGSATACYTLTINIGNTTFVREIDGSDTPFEEVKITPNPVAEVLNIEWHAEADAPAIIRLFDLTGREMKRIEKHMSKEITTNQMDVRNVQNGMYILTLQQGETLQTKKVVVNH
jgi:Pregnancy-associated plasma protein-A/Secretion system C-terminal sorting domain/Fibronectin type III domain